MSITFRCEHCGKDVKAPDSAGGKRGKCPYCHQSNYVPAPVSDDEVLDLAPEDEDYERHRREEIQTLRRKERDVNIEDADVESPPPLEQREDLAGQAPVAWRMRRTKARIVAAGIPVMVSATSGVKCWT